MDAGLLVKVFGSEGRWRGPCTVVVDADANVQTISTDSIVQGGIKVYAPRLISGRVAADAACLLPEHSAVVLVQKIQIRQATGEDIMKNTILLVDSAHVVALEFPDERVLAAFNLKLPERGSFTT